MHTRMRGLAGLLMLLSLAIGVPSALGATIGNPLHAWGQISAGDMSDQAVIAILAAVAWLGWASFAVALIVEFTQTAATRLTGRFARPVRIPLLGVQQDLARTLIASVLLLLGPAAATLDMPTRVYAAPVAASAQAPQTGSAVLSFPAGAVAPHRDLASAPVAHTATYLVPEHGGMSTYWDLAEHYLGAGQRWPEIWHLNAGRTQPDGAVMSSPQLLRRGWTVLIPAAVAGHDGTSSSEHVVAVRPGDTLSGLAASDGVSDWRTVWPANAGRREPGGEWFTDPDHIEPGWTIELPGPSNQSTSAPPRQHVPPPRHHPSTPPVQHIPAAPIPARPSTPTQTPQGGTSPVPTPASRDQRPVRAEQGDQWSAPSSIAVFTGGGLLLAGVTLAALLAHRRRAERWRSPGQIISATPAKLAPMEKTLLAAGHPAIVDVTWLDESLRWLVHTIAEQPDGRLPDVLAVRLADDELELVLAAPHPDPPAPWQAEQDGTRWRLARATKLDFDPARRDYHWAPYPTLASIGYTAAGDNWLIDLERVGAISLLGEPARCLNLARFIAAELAHNSWSEQLDVTLAGFGRELAELNPARLTYTDEFDKAITTLRRQCEQIDTEGIDVLASRLRSNTDDTPAPQVLLIAPNLAGDDDELDSLLTDLRNRAARATIAVVLTEDDQHPSTTRWQLHLDANATMRIPALGLQLTAQQLLAEEAADLAALLALAASGEHEAVGPARGDQPWDEFADAAGAPRAEITLQQTRQQLRDATTIDPADLPTAHNDEDQPRAGDSLLPLSTATYVQESAATADELDALAPVVRPEARRRIAEADPDLDADLAAWHDPSCLLPKLRLLGKPTLTAHGPLPPGRPRPDFYTEVATFVATHLGATAAQLGTALWPHDPDIASKTTPRQAVTVLRKWLGVDPRTGQEHIPHGGEGSVPGVYRVEGMLIDAELFRRLRLRATTHCQAGTAAGIADLLAALQLVHGVPLDRRPLRSRRGMDGNFTEPYAWLVDCPLDREYQVMIADTADTVATHCLGAGDPRRAAWAAQVALKAGDVSDTPLLNLMRACDAQGHRAEGDEWVRKIMDNHDAQIEEELPPRTYEVLRRRQWPEAG